MPVSSSSSSEDDLPNAEMIAKAKAKRLQLRRAHIAPGYIPSETPQFKGVMDYKRAEDAVKQGSDDEGSGSGEEAADDVRVKFAAGGASRHTCGRGH